MLIKFYVYSINAHSLLRCEKVTSLAYRHVSTPMFTEKFVSCLGNCLPVHFFQGPNGLTVFKSFYTCVNPIIFVNWPIKSEFIEL